MPDKSTATTAPFAASASAIAGTSGKADSAAAGGRTTSLLTFPCVFPLKIVGNAAPALVEEIREIVVHAVAETALAELIDISGQNISSSGRYQSMTLELRVPSQAWLDDLYRRLQQHPQVKFVL